MTTLTRMASFLAALCGLVAGAPASATTGLAYFSLG
jgi:hypothetical protein